MGVLEKKSKKRRGVNIKMTYYMKQFYKTCMENPILIEGLPGIGNVGKIAVDFMIENLKAKKMFDIHSNSFPHAVFVNEKNLIELPTIEIYHKKVNGQDFLLLAGDIQPVDEVSCYEFCHKLLDLFKKAKGKEIVTIGGIGLQRIPEDPFVYCTANSKSIIKNYRSDKLRNDIYGVVGPIIGVSGLLVGLAKQRNIPAIALLAETFSHPTYLGIKGAREVLKILNNRFKLKLDLTQLNEEIVEIEKEIQTKTKQLSMLQKKKGSKTDISYIG